MAEIGLNAIRHSYMPHPKETSDYALRGVDFTWEDGGAYALLGPSGCGKTTLLNIISGLLTPSEGSVFFDDKDVSGLPPDRRNIAQVFQFPVVYDTMTVGDNLAFPLRNRGFAEADIKKRVAEIADMLDLTETLGNRAAGLNADGKQKISLGRGLVRPDVSAILFDEPLTVIDPHLKWQLRSKLKELHQRIRATMIYVTHDQTEALTFADKVVVMYEGEVVQFGTPVELFEKPMHTFVGHFIGSPGMNLLPATQDFQALCGEQSLQARLSQASTSAGNADMQIGVRPEFLSIAQASGLPVAIERVTDAGRHLIVEARHAGHDAPIRLLHDVNMPLAEGETFLTAQPEHIHLYADGWHVDRSAP